MYNSYSCLSPVKILDVKGRSMYVNCGKCDYCRNVRRMELSARVEREIMYNVSTSGHMLFVTLTYDNSHLPVYSRANDGTWHSNRSSVMKTVIKFRGTEYQKRLKEQKYQPISDEDVIEYKKPLRFKYKEAFAHLCAEDVYSTIAKHRLRISYHFKKNRIEGYEYEDFKYRYFLCGEYGPNTFRPHYHAILFFPRRLDKQGLTYLSKSISKVWTYGTVDVQEVTTDGIKQYLSEYVTGTSGLPAILTDKSVRPFCTFSKVKSVGSYTFHPNQVLWELRTGVVERVEFDKDTSEFRTTPLPRTYLSRFFPKCTGFSTIHPNEKYRVYSYVYRLFKEKGITHTPFEVMKLRVSDIDFHLYQDLCYVNQARPVIINGEYYEIRKPQLASWIDRYCSLVCYQYCVLFNMRPDEVIYSFDEIYRKRSLATLGCYYESEEDITNDNLKWNILNDRDFVTSLPVHIGDLYDWQESALYRYGFALSEVYSETEGVLDPLFQMTYSIDNDPRYQLHKDKYEKYSKDAIKRKKQNEYINNRVSNRTFRRVKTFDGRYIYV